MNHQVEISGNAVVAVLSGTLDGETARGVAAALREKAFPGATVVLELSGVSGVDVEGITQLVTLKRRAEREQGKLVLAAPSYEVMEALRSNGLDRDFETAPTRDAALGGSAGYAPSHGGPPSFAQPPSFAPEPVYSPPPHSFAPEPAYAAPPPPPPPAYISTDPEPFISPPPPPPPAWTPEEPARRREEASDEGSEWVKASSAAPRADRPPPPVMAAPAAAYAAPTKKKKSALPLILVLLLLLGGGGAAAWWFLLRKKPEMVALTAAWEIEEGKDAEFEIKFKNAAGLVLKDGVMPNELYLDETIKDFADGQKSQTIKGTARDTGEFTLAYVAKPADGEASPPGSVKIRITAAPVTDASGGKLRELMVGVPVKAGVQELARGCVKATAEKLDGTGLTVKVDPLRKVASLQGKPEKDGDYQFSLKAENSDGQTGTFTYNLTIRPEPKPVVADTPPVTPPVVDTPPVTPPVDTPPVTPPVDTPPVTPPVDKPPVDTPPVTPPPPPPPVETLDPDMIIMLNERIARSRFPETEKIQMRAAVNEVRWAKKLATIPFAHGEKVISAAGKAELLAALGAEPELQNADALKDMDFVVVGYASKSGTLAQNIAISKSRAASVTAVLKSSEYAIEPKFTGDYGATDVLGGSEDANRVVEVYAVKVSESTRNALRKLIEDMKRISGAR
jgi:anti-anti-sigma factor